MKDFITEDRSPARIFRNPYHNFDAETWSALSSANALLLHWFTLSIDKYEWHQGDSPTIQEYMADEYERSAGSQPHKMAGVVDCFGDYTHEGDDDLAAYFIIKIKIGDQKRLAYIYPYAIVAMPKADGGYLVVRMD